MKKILFLTLTVVLVLGVMPVSASGPTTRNYNDITQNGWYWLDMAGEEWDLTQCDLTISYQLDMSGYTPPMWATAWSSIGVGGGAWGWMASGAPAAAQTEPSNQDIDDKLNLGAPDRYDEASYDATDPNTLVTPPIGDPWANYGVWFDRDGVDPYQANMWGMIDGKTYNTGGIYDVMVTFHAINPTLGTTFATVNDAQTGFYNTWKNAQPDHYPVGKSISGDLTKLQVFASIGGQNVKVYNLTATGCPYWTEVTIDIKPGSDPNCFNSDGHGAIPVAILGSADLDANEINPVTVKLDSLAVKAVGKSDKLLAHIEDVNSDGWDDLVVQIQDQDGAFTSGSGTAVLTGNLWDGTPLKGTDSICIVP